MYQNKDLNRRQCLKRTTVAVMAGMSFPYILPASALGKDGAIAPSNRITLGFIGTGGHGYKNLLRGFLSPSDTESEGKHGSSVQIVAVCDVDDLGGSLLAKIFNFAARLLFLILVAQKITAQSAYSGSQQCRFGIPADGLAEPRAAGGAPQGT